MSYPPRDTFDFNLSRRMYKYLMKERNVPPVQEIDKNHPGYRDKNPAAFDYRIIGGLIKNPIGDMWDITVSFQGYGMCADIEMSAMNCLEAYGLNKSLSKCQDHLEDLYECFSGAKSLERIKIMREERRRQFESGERKFKYAPPPKLGSFF